MDHSLKVGGGALELVTQVPRSLRPPLVVAHLSLPQRFGGLGVAAGGRSCPATTLGASWALETLYDMELISRQKHSYSQLHSVGNMQCAVAACLFIMHTVRVARLLRLQTAKQMQKMLGTITHFKIKAKRPALIRTLL